MQKNKNYNNNDYQNNNHNSNKKNNVSLDFSAFYSLFLVKVHQSTIDAF